MHIAETLIIIEYYLSSTWNFTSPYCFINVMTNFLLVIFLYESWHPEYRPQICYALSHLNSASCSSVSSSSLLMQSKYIFHFRRCYNGACLCSQLLGRLKQEDGLSPGVLGCSVLYQSGVCTKEGNKVTETIFTGVYYASRLREDNFSNSWALISVRSWIKYLQSLSPIPLQNAVTIIGNIAELAGGLQPCRASRKLLVDSEWGNQGEYQIQ
jgi:hypothetical protein